MKVAVVTRLVVLVALLQATHLMVAIHLLVTTSGISSLAALTLLTSAVVDLVVAPVVVLPSLNPQSDRVALTSIPVIPRYNISKLLA